MPIWASSVRDIPIHGATPYGLTWSGEFLWFSEAGTGRLIALDPVSGQVQQQVACRDIRTDLTTVQGNLVQVVGRSHALRMLDPATGSVVDERPGPRPGHALCGLEATRHGIWFGYADLQTAELRAPDDLALLATVPLRDPMAGVTASDHYLVYSCPHMSSISLVDVEKEREVASYTVPGVPTGITWDGTRIWYCDVATVQLRAIEVPGIYRH